MALWGLCGMRLFLSNIVLYLIYIFNIVVMYPYVCEGSCAKVIYRHLILHRVFICPYLVARTLYPSTM